MNMIKRGEVYYVDLGENTGCEVNKVRPCLIIQNDIGNRYSPTTIVAPISHRSAGQNPLPTQVPLKPGMFLFRNNLVEGTVLLEQIRTVDKTRINFNCIAKLTSSAMKLIENATLISLAL